MYSGNYEKRNLELIYNRTTDKSESFNLYQNFPNPFDDFTIVRFDLPSDAPAVINVYNVSGRKIYSRSGDFRRGINQIELRKEELKEPGILYLEIISDQYRASKKMMLMD